MSTLLVLDTSPRKDAISRRLTQKFVDEWRTRNPGGRVLRQDIGAEPLDHLDDELIDALRRNPSSLSQRQLEALAASDSMIDQLQQADMIVIGAPMHNFTITGAFRTWIDHIARPGKTFGYDPNSGPHGLLKDKPVFIVSTRGGDYGEGDPDDTHPADFQSDYLRHILRFIGLTSVQMIAANGMDMGDEPRAAGLAAAEAKIDAALA